MSRIDLRQWREALRTRRPESALSAVIGIGAAVLICAPFWIVVALVWRSCR
jgi:uncharacterized protein involved in exopolysaccharide biosynthesis